MKSSLGPAPGLTNVCNEDGLVCLWLKNFLSQIVPKAPTDKDIPQLSPEDSALQWLNGCQLLLKEQVTPFELKKELLSFLPLKLF